MMGPLLGVALVVAGGLGGRAPAVERGPAHPGPAPPGLEAALRDWRSIPAFSRAYRTSCATCHIVPGKLNAQGEVFRLNGYRFPDEESRLRTDAIPLGADPWKDLWPEAVWPGEIPGALPLSLYIANDTRFARSAGGPIVADLFFPTVVVLHAGASLGEGIGAFFAAGWIPGAGMQVFEAKAGLLDPVPGLPPRAVNVWVGSQRPHLLTFGDFSLDRGLRQPFLWQRFRLSEWPLEDAAGQRALVSASSFDLSGSRPSIEINGLGAGRIYYALGLAQTASPGGPEFGRGADVYLKLRYKLGGLRLDGDLPTGGDDPATWGGQLLDRGLVLEHFAYSGTTTLESGARDEHRSFGVAVRALLDRADTGVGWVWSRHSRPWDVAGIEAHTSSLFGRGEYLLYPWLLASLKADRTVLRADSAGPGPELRPSHRTRALPGVAVLLRHNVRVLAEGEIFLEDRPPTRTDGEAAHALWLRLDLAF